jgi:hypothetical protein
MSQVIGDDVDCLLAPEKSTDRNACFEKKGMCYAINNGTKNECFVRNRVNIDTMCSVLKSVESRNDCYIGAAIANDDIRICSNLSETRDENFLNRDYCRVVITKPGERTKAFCNTLAPDSREGCLLDAVK